MEYNTQRPSMKIAEYGRNIQKMIEYLTTLEDREKRTRGAHFIVNIMAQMHPAVKESGDFKHKLWDHMHIISNFKLDVDGPYPPPNIEDITARPDPIAYSENEIRYRHYGKNIESIISKAIEYEEGEEKEALIAAIANHLKKSYLTWNRDSVNDELIFQHLEELSKGKLELSDEKKLHSTNDILAINRSKKKSRTPSSNQNYSRRRRQ